MTDTPNDPAIEKMRARVKEFGEAHRGVLYERMRKLAIKAIEDTGSEVTEERIWDLTRMPWEPKWSEMDEKPVPAVPDSCEGCDQEKPVCCLVSGCPDGVETVRTKEDVQRLAGKGHDPRWGIGAIERMLPSEDDAPDGADWEAIGKLAGPYPKGISMSAAIDHLARALLELRESQHYNHAWVESVHGDHEERIRALNSQMDVVIQQLEGVDKRFENGQAGSNARDNRIDRLEGNSVQEGDRLTLVTSNGYECVMTVRGVE